MKFYLIQISEGDSKISGKSIYEYTTLNEAVADFHKKLGVAMGSNLYTSALLMVVNSEGGVHQNEKYTVEVEETETSEE